MIFLKGCWGLVVLKMKGARLGEGDHCQRGGKMYGGRRVVLRGEAICRMEYWAGRDLEVGQEAMSGAGLSSR